MCRGKLVHEENGFMSWDTPGTGVTHLYLPWFIGQIGKQKNYKTSITYLAIKVLYPPGTECGAQ
jgi:hypothetical protein